MRNAIRSGAAVIGVIGALFGLLGGVALGALSLVSQEAPPVIGTTIALAMIAAGAGLGAVLAIAAWASWTQRASKPARLPRAGWLLLAFVVLLGVGRVVLLTPLDVILLPPIHIAVALLPPMIVAALLLPIFQRAGVGFTRRSVATQFAYGGLVAAGVSILLEGIVLAGVIIAALVGLGMLPGGEANLEALAQLLQSPEAVSDPLGALSTYLTPGVILGGGLLVAAALPLVEEVVKSLGAVLHGITLGKLTRSQAFFFGVLAGLGFSFLEALFYAAQGLPDGWLGAVLLRSLTAVVHAASTGLFALGWYEVAARRPARFWPYALGGWAIHGLWNGLSLAAAVTGLSTLTGNNSSSLLNGTLGVLVIALLGTLWVLALAVLIRQARQLGAEAQAASLLPPA